MISVEELIERVNVFVDCKDYYGAVRFLEGIKSMEDRQKVGLCAFVLCGVDIAVSQGENVVLVKVDGEYSSESLAKIIRFVPEDNPIRRYYYSTLDPALSK